MLNPADKEKAVKKPGRFARALGELFKGNDPQDSGDGGQSTDMANDPSVLAIGGKDLAKSIQDMFGASNDRKLKHIEFDELDTEPMPSAALDIYASMVCLGELEGDDTNAAYTLKCPNPDQQKILEQMETRLNLKSKLWGKVRRMVKYGWNPSEIVFKGYVGISNFRSLPPANLRLADETKEIAEQELPWVLVDDNGEVKMKFKNFQICPMRTEYDEMTAYGRSILEPVRRTGKIIALLENSAAYRELSRSARRWLWKIASDGLSPDEALAYTKRFMNSYSKQRFINSKGMIDLARNPLTDMTDIAFPVTKETGGIVGIEGLPNDTGSSSIEMIEHFQSKFCVGVRISVHHLAFNKSTAGPRLRGQLTHTDVQLAKAVYRLQAATAADLYDVYLHESQFHGISDGDFKLVFPVIGTVDEMLKLQMLNLKISIATSLRVSLKMVDDEWVFDFLKFPPALVERLRLFRKLVRQEEHDMLQAAADGVFLQPISTAGAADDDVQSPYDLITARTNPAMQPAPGGMPPPAAGESLTPSNALLHRVLQETGSIKRSMVLERLANQKVQEELRRDERVKAISKDIHELLGLQEAVVAQPKS